MKDFSKQIMFILESKMNIDITADENKVRIQGLSNVSEAINDINLFIQSEIRGLEEQVVNLTEELNETDYLLISANNAKTQSLTHSRYKTRTGTLPRHKVHS